MGLRSFAWEDPRHQLKRHIHRIHRHALGRSGLHGAPSARSARADGLFSEARRARPRHGRQCYRVGRAAPAALSGFDRLTYSPPDLMTSARPRASFYTKQDVVAGAVQGELTAVPVIHRGSFYDAMP